MGSEDISDTKLYHFPGFDPDGAAWLAENRNIYGVGVDVMTLEPGNLVQKIFTANRTVHNEILSRNLYGIENVKNLALLPPVGATVYVGAIKWSDAGGAPCRLFAIWGEDTSGAEMTEPYNYLIGLISLIWIGFVYRSFSVAVNILPNPDLNLCKGF